MTLQWRLLTAAGLQQALTRVPVGLPAPPFSQCRNSHYPPQRATLALAVMNETLQYGQY